MNARHLAVLSRIWVVWSAALLTNTAVASTADHVAGWWSIVDEIEATDYEPFRGLRLEYRVRFRQEGRWIFGEGRKVRERGYALPPSRQTAIAIVGTVDGGRVTASLVEKGHRRESEGQFAWTLARDGTRMVGTFRSNAAGSTGPSTAARLSSGGSGSQ